MIGTQIRLQKRPRMLQIKRKPLRKRLRKQLAATAGVRKEAKARIIRVKVVRAMEAKARIKRGAAAKRWKVYGFRRESD